MIRKRRDAIYYSVTTCGSSCPGKKARLQTLSAGTHALIIRGREAGAQLDRIQILRVPLLSFTRTGTNNLLVSWPAYSTGWTLQQNGSASTTNWADVVTSPSDNGATRSVGVSLSGTGTFYRLKQP